MTRARYLFELASVTHVTPGETDAMRVADFAVLVAGIDAYRAAIAKARG